MEGLGGTFMAGGHDPLKLSPELPGSSYGFSTYQKINRILPGKIYPSSTQKNTKTEKVRLPDRRSQKEANETISYNADGLSVTVPYSLHKMAVTADELRHYTGNINRTIFTGEDLDQEIRYKFAIHDGKLMVTGARTTARFSKSPETSRPGPMPGLTTDSTSHHILLRTRVNAGTNSLLYITRRRPVVLQDEMSSALHVKDDLKDLEGYYQTNYIEEDLKSDISLLYQQIGGFRELRDLLGAMRITSGFVSQREAFNTKSASSSNPSIVVASAKSNAGEGSISITVEQRAKTHIIRSDAYSDPYANLDTGDNDKGSFTINGYKIEVDIAWTNDDNPDFREVDYRKRSLVGIMDQINYGMEDANKNGIIDGHEESVTIGDENYLMITDNEDETLDPNEGTDNPNDDKNFDEKINTSSEIIGVKARIEGGRLVLESIKPGQRIILKNTSDPDPLIEDNILEAIGLTKTNLQGHDVIKNEVQAPQPAIFTVNGKRYTRYTNEIDDIIDGLTINLNSTSSSIWVEDLRKGFSVQEGQEIDSVIDDLIEEQVITPTTLKTYSPITLNVSSSAEKPLGLVEELINDYNSSMMKMNDLLKFEKKNYLDPALQGMRVQAVQGAQFPVTDLPADSDDITDIGIEEVNKEKDNIHQASISQFKREVSSRGGMVGKGVLFGQGEKSIFESLRGLGIRTLEDDTLKADRTTLSTKISKDPDMVADIFTNEDDGVAVRLNDILDRDLDPETGVIALRIAFLEYRIQQVAALVEERMKEGNVTIIEEKLGRIMDILA